MAFFMKELVESFLGDDDVHEGMKTTIVRKSGRSGVHRGDENQIGKKT